MIGCGNMKEAGMWSSRRCFPIMSFWKVRTRSDLQESLGSMRRFLRSWADGMLWFRYREKKSNFFGDCVGKHIIPECPRAIFGVDTPM